MHKRDGGCEMKTHKDGKNCQWWQEDYYGDDWQAECGRWFHFSTGAFPSDVQMRYCPFCGRNLVEIPATEDDKEGAK
jgi:hypothetical protein